MAFITKQSLVFIMTITVLCLPAAADSKQAAKLKSLDMHSLLEPVRIEYNVPALAGAIVYGRQVVSYGAVGLRKAGSDTKVTDNDKFHMGSCTKAMTATMIGRLVEQGKLNWDDTIGSVLGKQLEQKINAAYADVNLKQLLSHWGGLPSESWPKGMSFLDVHKLSGSPREQRLEYAKRILTQKPTVTPGSKYIYSNAGYSIAAVMAEEVMDKSWESLMRTMVFDPCGMKTAGFGAMGSPGKIDQPWQHKCEMGLHIPVEPGPISDNPPAIAPGGTAHCSMLDWAKFVAVHISGMTDKHRFLKDETLETLHSPTYGGDYAMGWLVTKRDWAAGKALHHSGSNNMNYAVVWISPKKNFAVMAATNQGGDKAFKACDKAVSEMINRITAAIDH